MRPDIKTQVEQLRARNSAIRTNVVQLRKLMDSLQALVAALDQPIPDERVVSALDEALGRALDATQAASAALLVLDEDSGELVVVLVRGDAPADGLAWKRMPGGAGIKGWSLHHREAVIANDARVDERFDPHVDNLLGLVTQSLMVVPVLCAGEAMALYEFRNKQGQGMFNEDDQTLVSLMGRFAGALLGRMARRQLERAP